MSGFGRDVDEICVLLEYYAALSGSSVPTFRDNLSVPSSRIKKSKTWISWPLEDGTDRLSRNLDFLTLEDGTYRLSRNVGIFKSQEVQDLDFLTLKDGTDNLSWNLDFLTLEVETYWLFRNFGTELPLNAA
jgi:hypothetical protein